MATKNIPISVVIGLAIFAAIVGASVRQIQYSSDEKNLEIRPEFSLADLQNNQRSIKEWDGKLVLVNFWASWCPPCVKEMPALDQLRLENQHRDFEVIGVTAEPRKDAITYLAQHPVSYPILDGESSASALGQLYGNTVGSIPFSVLIDKHGQIQRRYYGEIDLQTLMSDINTFS